MSWLAIAGVVAGVVVVLYLGLAYLFFVVAGEHLR